MGSTKTDLVNDLENVLDTQVMTQAKRRRIVQIQKDAKAGMFHDFETDLATPKMELRTLLAMEDLTELADKVKNGDYDE